MEYPIRPASRESTIHAQEITLAFLIRRYLARKGYKVGHLSVEAMMRRLEHSYRLEKIYADGKTLNEITTERKS